MSKPRKASKAAQRRAVTQQQAVPGKAAPVALWYCGGCGTTLPVGFVYQDDDRTWHASESSHVGAAHVATARGCPEPFCDARLVRCEKCGGGKAAREALARHTCRAVLA